MRHRTIGQISTATAALLGCTPAHVQDSPESPSGTPPAEMAPPEKKVRHVSDPGGRWSLKVESTGEIQTFDRPGFLHLVIPRAPESSINCFVYEKNLQVGQSVQSFFQSVQTGLDFDDFRPLDLSVVNDIPLLSLSGRYTVRTGERESGHLFVAIFPRISFPMVCSLEEDTEVAFHPVVADIAKGLRAAEEPRFQPFLQEIWRASHDDELSGFHVHRFYKAQDGKVTSAFVGAEFLWNDDKLVTRDLLMIETEDSWGLSNAQWGAVDSDGGSLEFVLERQAGEGREREHRYRGEFNGRTTQGAFSSAPLSTFHHYYQWLTSGDTSSVTHQRFDLATLKVQDKKMVREGASVAIQQNEISQVSLGDDQLPRISTPAPGSKSPTTELLMRKGKPL